MAVCVACGAQVQKVTRDGLCWDCYAEVKQKPLDRPSRVVGEDPREQSTQQIVQALRQLKNAVDDQTRIVKHLDLLVSIFFYVWAAGMVLAVIAAAVGWAGLVAAGR